MKMKNILKSILLGGAVLTAAASCSVEPTYHSEVSPDTYYTSREAVLQRFYRPFTHARWTFAQMNGYFDLQEFSADAFCSPVRGTKNTDRAEMYKLHYHEFIIDPIANGWSDLHQCYITRMQGVSRCWAAISDLSEVDLDKFGFTEADWNNWRAQLSTMAALYYLQLLDLFGGMPLYSENAYVENYRSSAEETFYFIENLLTESLPNLEKKTVLGGTERGDVRQAMGAHVLMQLYFNAESYIGVPMYDKAAKLAEDIIGGVYGAYDLDSDWTQTFGFHNDVSKEIIWSIPSERSQLETDGFYLWQYSMPNRMRFYFNGKNSGDEKGLPSSSANNCWCLQPSLDGEGNPYTFKLGRPFAKFNDKDVRKRMYRYLGNGEYEGMFFFGELVNPDYPDCKVLGREEYRNQVLNLVDQIARKSEGGTESSMETGEENSGIRMVKYSPRPYLDEVGLLFNPDIPVLRLSEVYYTLAECKFRSNDTQGCADLINHVRKRYFEDGVDPDPCTASMDKYRLLDEWLIEFLGESRRRTDLVRWGEYTMGEWWDHQPDGPGMEYKNIFPLNADDVDATDKLPQNPGYTD